MCGQATPSLPYVWKEFKNMAELHTNLLNELSTELRDDSSWKFESRKGLLYGDLITRSDQYNTISILVQSGVVWCDRFTPSCLVFFLFFFVFSIPYISFNDIFLC